MKKINKKTVFLILISGLVIIGLFFLYSGSSKFNNRESGTKDMDEALQGIIKTAMPAQKNFRETRHFFGKVKTMNRADIIATETGKITSVNITEGMPVTKGQLLFIIGGPLIDYKLKMIADKIILFKKRIVLAEQIFKNDRRIFPLHKKIQQLKSRIVLAEKAVELNKKAFAEKFIKQNDLINSMDVLAARKYELISVNQAIKIHCLSDKDIIVKLKAELKATMQKRKILKKAVHIRAGFNGFVTGCMVLSPGGQVQKGDKLSQIVSQKDIYIRAVIFLQKKEIKLKGKKAFIHIPVDFSNNLLRNIPANNSCTKKLHSQNIKNILHAGIIFGTITNVLPLRTAAGADIVWIKSRDFEFFFKPCEVVSGNIVLSTHKNALAVPESAIVQDRYGNSFVFLKVPASSNSPVHPDSSAFHDFSNSPGFYKTSVKTGILSHGWVEILRGLKKKDKIVVQGAYELFYNNFNRIYKVVD